MTMKTIFLILLFASLSFAQSTDFMPLMGDENCTQGVNLFNKNTITVNKSLTQGVLVDNAGYDVSDFIPVIPGEIYATKYLRNIAYYDANKTYVSQNVVNSGLATAITIPATAYYLRTAVSHTDGGAYTTLDIYQFVKQDSIYFPLKSPFGCFEGKWVNQIWSSLGNSITFQYTWQPTVFESLGLRHSNYGIGGTTIGGTGDSAMWKDVRIDEIDEYSNLINFMGGSNDFGQSVPIGTSDNLDTTTFYGGLNTIINKLLANYPNAKIILTTPPYYPYVATWAAKGWADSLTNLENLKFIDYVDAINTLGAERDIPVCNIYTLCGIDSTNYATYLADLVHPTASGGILIGTALKNYLNGDYTKIQNETIIPPIPKITVAGDVGKITITNTSIGVKDSIRIYRGTFANPTTWVYSIAPNTVKIDSPLVRGVVYHYRAKTLDGSLLSKYSSDVSDTSNYTPGAETYFARVLADGGTVNDHLWVDSIYQFLSDSTLTDSVAAIYAYDAGVEKDVANNFLKLYNLANLYDAVQPDTTLSFDLSNNGMYADSSDYMTATGVESFFGGDDAKLYLMTVINFSNDVIGSCVWDMGKVGATNTYWGVFRSSGSKVYTQKRDDATTSVSVNSGTTLTQNAYFMLEVNVPGATLTYYINGSVSGTPNSAYNVSTFTPDKFYIGALYRVPVISFLKGYYKFILLFKNDISDTKRQALETLINSHYSVY